VPLIRAANAAVVQLHGVTFTCLVAPSRGARETNLWRVQVPAGVPGAEHTLDHEEVLLVLAGRAQAHVAGEACVLEPGDGLVVPAHARFSLANPFDELFEAIAVLPVGAQARMLDGGDPFVPPCAR
jgi:mannose-6-phosphate isomerase-like protein (cupin superfamily)